MDQRAPDPSAHSNRRILRELLHPIPLSRIPYLGPHPMRLEAIRENEKKLKKNLATILGLP
jgi:hypothetical protein